MPRAVFLDRDDTLIVNDGDLGDPGAVRLVADAADACARLKALGFRLVVVTNQGGVARGAFDERAVDATHHRVEGLLREAIGADRVIDGFYHCPFHPEGSVARYARDHPWRKPASGMLLAAARDLEIDLRASWMIGDAERDIVAGRDASCRTILVAADPVSARRTSDADFVDASLGAAARRIEAAERADLRTRTTVRLRALHGTPFADPALRDRVESAARALAERIGVELMAIELAPDSVVATLVGEEIVGVGFAAELRRTTDAWYRSKHGRGLWSGRP